MKKTEIMNKFTRGMNKAKFKMKKHSPEILIVVGVAGAVVSAVMACRATIKISGILDEAKEDLDTIHEAKNNVDLADRYSAEDGKKDTIIVYAHTGFKLVKLYAPSVILGTLSITSILASNNILRKRNMALAAAYATVDKSFKEYRSRVVERFGENVDRELRYNIKAKEVEEKVVDENGEEKTVTKTVEMAGIDGCSAYARYFDSSSPYWEESPEHNLFFLKSEQNYANDLLKLKGFVTLNEVYERLGLPGTNAGLVVGWVYDADNPVGDNYIDFGLFETNRESVRDFVNGYESVVLLDFNVDGNIYEKL